MADQEDLPLEEYPVIPDDQQEDEDDLPKNVSFKDAVVMNADWTIETIDSQINKGNIDLQPGFQRRAAWDDTRKSRLIESVIVGMPVPNIVLAENKDHRGRFIVIDGKQRLLSINEFIKGAYTLRGLDMRSDLNKLTYANLPSADKEYLDNSTIRSTVIKNWSENFLYKTFFRLNSGSLPLSPQELRKTLIGGKLLESIENYLVNSKAFHTTFGDGLDKRMRDSELVLRFIAYDRALMDYRGDFKEFLDKTTTYYEESDWAAVEADVLAKFTRLDNALTAANAVFGKDCFKKWLGNKYERVINRAIFDCIARFFAEPVVAQAAIARSVDVVQCFKAVCLETEFKDAVEKTPKTTGATNSRIALWGERLSYTIGLAFDKDTLRIV